MSSPWRELVTMAPHPTSESTENWRIWSQVKFRCTQVSKKISSQFRRTTLTVVPNTFLITLTLLSRLRILTVLLINSTTLLKVSMSLTNVNLSVRAIHASTIGLKQLRWVRPLLVCQARILSMQKKFFTPKEELVRRDLSTPKCTNVPTLTTTQVNSV